MKKKTIWKSPNAEMKSFKEKDLLKILSSDKKTKDFLKKLNDVEKSTNKVKSNAETFINITKNNVDEMVNQLKFDSPFIWFTFIKKCLPHSLNNEDFITKLQSFVIGYLLENNDELYELFKNEIENSKKETTNGEVQDK